MPLRYPRLYNGVRIVDRPCLPNAIRIDQGAMPMIAEMNATGLLINPAHFTALDAEIAVHQMAKQETLDTEIRGMFPWLLKDGTFNVKGDNVGKLLFDEIKVHEAAGIKAEYTAGGKYSTNADYLANFKGVNPIVDTILDIRELRTIRSTFTGPLPSYADADGRIRPTLKMDIARTGRLSCEDPNLQNQVAQEPWGPKLRAGYIASKGYELASIDLAQIEMVYAADEAGDVEMIKVFQNKEDMHTKSACAVFQLEYDQIRPLWQAYQRYDAGGGDIDPNVLKAMKRFKVEKRLVSKPIGFGILYGTAAPGLVTQIVSAGGPRVTVEEAERFIKNWFVMFRGVRAWIEHQHARALRFGMSWNRFGRVRLLPGAQSPVKSASSEALRMSSNTPIQSGSGDHLKIAMAEIYQTLIPYYRWKYGQDCIRCCLQIHDELLFEGLAGGLIREFAADVQRILQRAVPMANGVPVGSSAGFAFDWGGLK